MSDLFSPLRDYDPPVRPLEAGEVRRLGERRHRRRTIAALSVVASLVIVAVAVGVSGTRSATDTTPVPPALEPTAPPEPGLIPEDFRLGRGLPPFAQGFLARGPDAGSPVGTIVPVCGSDYVLPGEPVDRAIIEGDYPPYVGLRDVAVYPTPAAATEAVDTLMEMFEGCLREPDGVGVTVTTITPMAGLGDRAWTIMRDYRQNGELRIASPWFLVQDGRAVLVMWEEDGGEKLLDPDTRQAFLDRFRSRTLEPIVADLCSIEGVC